MLKRYLKQIRWEGVNWICLAQGRVMWQHTWDFVFLCGCFRCWNWIMYVLHVCFRTWSLIACELSLWDTMRITQPIGISMAHGCIEKIIQKL
jgi:hypothetical protein